MYYCFVDLPTNLELQLDTMSVYSLQLNLAKWMFKCNCFGSSVVVVSILSPNDIELSNSPVNYCLNGSCSKLTLL